MTPENARRHLLCLAAGDTEHMNTDELIQLRGNDGTSATFEIKRNGAVRVDIWHTTYEKALAIAQLLSIPTITTTKS